MKFFSLIFKNDEVVPNKKVLAPEAFSALLDAKELLEKQKKIVNLTLMQQKKNVKYYVKMRKSKALKKAVNNGILNLPI